MTYHSYSEGLTDSYTSTGTLSRILQQVHKDYQPTDDDEDDDEEFEYEVLPQQDNNE